MQAGYPAGQPGYGPPQPAGGYGYGQPGQPGVTYGQPAMPAAYGQPSFQPSYAQQQPYPPAGAGPENVHVQLPSAQASYTVAGKPQPHPPGDDNFQLPPNGIAIFYFWICAISLNIVHIS